MCLLLEPSVVLSGGYQGRYLMGLGRYGFGLRVLGFTVGGKVLYH